MEDLKSIVASNLIRLRTEAGMTQAELGAKLITRDGNEFDLKAQGWNPLAE